MLKMCPLFIQNSMTDISVRFDSCNPLSRTDTPIIRSAPLSPLPRPRHCPESQEGTLACRGPVYTGHLGPIWSNVGFSLWLQYSPKLGIWGPAGGMRSHRPFSITLAQGLFSVQLPVSLLLPSWQHPSSFMPWRLRGPEQERPQGLCRDLLPPMCSRHLPQPGPGRTSLSALPTWIQLPPR